MSNNQQIGKMVGFDNQQDVVILNKLLEEINRRATLIPDPSSLAVIKYFSTIPTAADIPLGTLGIYDIGAGSPKRFYFKTNLGALAYIEVGYYDSDLGVWVAGA